MAIAKYPVRKTENPGERQAEKFIAKAGGHAAEPNEEGEGNRKPTMVRIHGELLDRAGRAARRLGISRSAFICLSVAEKLERMDG